MNKVYKAKHDIGISLMIISTALLLLWIGVFKFTPTEAKAIKPLMESHPLLSWLYKILSVQSVSCIIGVVEICTGLLLLVGFRIQNLMKYAGLLLILTFGITISFLFTTQNSWKVVDNILVTNFFILKDLIPFGLGIYLCKGYNETDKEYVV